MQFDPLRTKSRSMYFFRVYTENVCFFRAYVETYMGP